MMALIPTESRIGWYKMGSRKYYSKCYRNEDGHVSTLYYGSGPDAELAAASYERLRARRLERAAGLRSRRSRFRSDERAITDYCRNVDELHDAWRRASGWHRHADGPGTGGSWRRTGKINRGTLMAKNMKSIDEATKQREFADWLASANYDAMFKRYGADMGKRIVDMIINNISEDLWARQATVLRFEQLKRELAGESPTKIVQVLAERVAVTHFDSYYSDMLVHANSDPELGKFLLDRQERVHNRYIRSIKALAEVRRIEAEAIDQQVKKFRVVG
jgi:hypothetical protein